MTQFLVIHVLLRLLPILHNVLCVKCGFIMTTNLTISQLVNLDNGAKYKCKDYLDICQFHNSKNEFDNPCSNVPMLSE